MEQPARSCSDGELNFDETERKACQECHESGSAADAHRPCQADPSAEPFAEVEEIVEVPVQTLADKVIQVPLFDAAPVPMTQEEIAQVHDRRTRPRFYSQKLGRFVEDHVM